MYTNCPLPGWLKMVWIGKLTHICMTTIPGIVITPPNKNSKNASTATCMCLVAKGTIWKIPPSTCVPMVWPINSISPERPERVVSQEEAALAGDGRVDVSVTRRDLKDGGGFAEEAGSGARVWVGRGTLYRSKTSFYWSWSVGHTKRLLKELTVQVLQDLWTCRIQLRWILSKEGAFDRLSTVEVWMRCLQELGRLRFWTPRPTCPTQRQSNTIMLSFHLRQYCQLY